MRRGETLLAHRLRTPLAEIDLLFEHPRERHWTLVEVKTWNRQWRGDLWGPSLISARQMHRLRLARLFLEGRARGRPVRLAIAVVEVPRGGFSGGNQRVQYFDPPDELAL